MLKYSRHLKNTDLRVKNSVAGWQKADKTSPILS